MTKDTHDTEAQIVARLERARRKQQGLRPPRNPNWRDRYNKAMENFVPAPF